MVAFHRRQRCRQTFGGERKIWRGLANAQLRIQMKRSNTCFPQLQTRREKPQSKQPSMRAGDALTRLRQKDFQIIPPEFFFVPKLSHYRVLELFDKTAD
jgi:hypothetical protein